MTETQRTSENARCLADFLLDVQAANRAIGTLQFYREKLTAFLAYLAEQGITTPQAITPQSIRSFLISLQPHHSTGGVHAYWRAMRAFMRFLLREDVLERNPLNRVRTPEVEQPILDPIAPEVMNALLGTCDTTTIGTRDKAILLTLLDTGLRAGELLRLTVADVDLNDGSITIHKSKSRKGRIVFISPFTRRALRRYLRNRTEDNAALFLSNSGAALTYDTLRAIITRRAKQAGVKPPALHSFRRTFALTMLRNGADVVTLSRLMGHGSLPVVQRYLKQLKDDLGNVHSKNSPVESIVKRGRKRDPPKE